MPGQAKSFDHPDETIRLEKVVQQLVNLGDLTVAHRVFEPGWRWTTHMRPRVGGELCQARHVGIILSGRLGVMFPDGTKFEIGPNEVYDIPPNHDGYVIGDEPMVQVEWSGTRSFLGHRAGTRVLATLMMTDIVGSTEMASRLGDAAWRTKVSSHFEEARARLDRYGGREVKTAGDGILATFDGPAPALQCAAEICRGATEDGIVLRCAVHVGEVERVGNDVRGIAVHEVARIMAESQGHEILVSDMTRMLASASGFSFQDKGARVLKGLPGEWRLYALAPGG
jgi:class 3 adenylate cyclase